MLAGLLQKMEKGDNQHTKVAVPIGTISKADAANKFNVGTRSVARARKVQEHGIPESA
jgi:hypothetical protein